MDTQNSEPKKIKTDEDRLSTLPDDLLLEILSMTMSYKEALKCSAVSKRFQHLHTLLPRLYFSESETVRKYLITKILYSALRDHRANIDTFSLEMEYELEFWHWCLLFVSTYPIKHLNLICTAPTIFPFSPFLNDFPFSCRHLVTLNLYNVEFTPPSNFYFPKLQECSLLLIDGHPIRCDEFLPRCPVLRHLKLEALFPFRPTLLSLTLSSPSLQSFGWELQYTEDEDDDDSTLQIILDMPLLSHLHMDCTEFESKMEVKIRAPKLQEITLKQYFPCIQCNQVVWKDDVFLRRAQWNSRQDLVYLDLETAVEDKLLELKDLGPYATLEALTVSDFVVSTFRIVEMLYQLPLLESLTLSYCSFENEDLHASTCQDADWVVSDNSTTDDILYTKGFDRDVRLREVSIDFHDYLFLGSSQAREMLLLFWKKLPCLKRFTVSVSSKKEDLNDANCCLHFFSCLLYHGDSVHMHRNDRSTEFQLIKKTA